VHTTLVKLGLVIHLNHQGRPCSRPLPGGARTLSVVDMSGVHDVSMVFCECRSASLGNARRDQLIRHGFYPSTWKKIKTVFTMDLLKTFHVRLHAGPVELELITDITGSSSICSLS
jgi:hypothetical protein